MSGFFDNVALTQLTDTIDAELVGAERMAAMEDLAEITRLGADLERYTLLNAGLEAFEEEMNATTTSLVLLALDEDVALEEDKVGLLKRAGSKIGKVLKDLIDRIVSFFKNMKNPFNKNKVELKKAKQEFLALPKPPKEEVDKVIKKAKAESKNTEVPDADWKAVDKFAKTSMSDRVPKTPEEMRALLIKKQAEIKSREAKAVVKELADIVVKAKETKYQTETIKGEEHLVFPSRVSRGFGGVSDLKSLKSKHTADWYEFIPLTNVANDLSKGTDLFKTKEAVEVINLAKRSLRTRIAKSPQENDVKFTVPVKEFPELIKALEEGVNDFQNLGDQLGSALTKIKSGGKFKDNETMVNQLANVVAMVAKIATAYSASVDAVTSKVNG